jgi:hypothetical protein
MTGRVLPPSMGPAQRPPTSAASIMKEPADSRPRPRRAANQWCHVDPNEDSPGWIVIYGNVTKAGCHCR